MTFANAINWNKLDGPRWENLGIAYSAGTFTVKGANADLSNNNPAYVILPSKTTPGEFVRYRVTANQTFTDGSAGSIDNMRWNLTTGVNASVDIPFFIYAVGDDTQTSISFMISRIPHATSSPTSTKIGKSGAVVNVGAGDFFSLADITTTSYDANPCACLGSFRMQFTGATDSWTVQTLAATDGFGRYQEGVAFTMPRGQFGAAANKYFLNNGGTAPDDADGGYTYVLTRQGEIFLSSSAPQIDTAGVGAVTCKLAIPFKTTQANVIICGYQSGSSIFSTFIADALSTQTNTNSIVYINDTGTGINQNLNFPLNSTYSIQGYYLINLD